MKNWFHVQNPGIKRLFIVNGLCLAVCLAALLFSNALEELPKERLLERRWSKEGGYGQVSVFLPKYAAFSLDDIHWLRANIGEELKNADKGGGHSGWTDAYSLEDYMFVSREGETAEALVTAVGGQFFLFQQIPLLTGSYFWENDSNTDLVIIDEELSFRLFGSTNVAGLQVEIGGSPFTVSGVSKCEDHFAYEAAYGELPRMYMAYSSYEKMVSGEEGNGNGSGFGNHPGDLTVYQVLLPEAVEHYAYDVLGNLLDGMGKSYSIVEDSGRYAPGRLLHIFGEFGKRSMRLTDIGYPYWENAARMIEDYAVLLLVVRILSLIFPVCCVLFCCKVRKRKI